MAEKANLIKSNEGKLFLYTPEYDTVKERLERKMTQDEKFVRFASVIEYRREFVNDLAKICSASIMSDDSHQDEETFVAQDICREMFINWDEFEDILKKEIESVKSSNFESVKDYLVASGLNKETKNIMPLFEAALHIILADGIMTDREAMLLADLAEILGVPTNKVISRISQFLRFEHEVLIDVSL